MRSKKIPLAITGIGWLYIAVGIVSMVYHLHEAWAKYGFELDLVWIELIGLSALGIGVFLVRGKTWARWFAVGWMGFHVGVTAFNGFHGFIVHCVLFVLITWALLTLRLGKRGLRGYCYALPLRS